MELTLKNTVWETVVRKYSSGNSKANLSNFWEAGPK